jgi:hypothetical protein
VSIRGLAKRRGGSSGKQWFYFSRVPALCESELALIDHCGSFDRLGRTVAEHTFSPTVVLCKIIFGCRFSLRSQTSQPASFRIRTHCISEDRFGFRALLFSSDPFRFSLPVVSSEIFALDCKRFLVEGVGSHVSFQSVAPLAGTYELRVRRFEQIAHVRCPTVAAAGLRRDRS